MKTPEYLDQETLKWCAKFAESEERELLRNAKQLGHVRELRERFEHQAAGMGQIARSLRRRASAIGKKQRATGTRPAVQPDPAGDAL